MAQGALIGESMRIGSVLEPPSLVLKKITRADCGHVDSGQPRTWTFIEFELPDDDAPAWADALTGVLLHEHGWYCDFQTATEKFVVFAGKVFRYPRGDLHQRAEVAAHARSVGVPEHQLDWPE